MFRNRQHAGELLADRLVLFLQEQDNSNKNGTIVIALPRGGVPVGFEIALALSCPLDVLVSKKIGAPYQSELAVGAVTSDGTAVLNDELLKNMDIDAGYLKKQKEYLIDKTKELEEYWRSLAGIKESPNLHQAQVILVDDGIATGMTAIAACKSVRQKGVQEIILVTPVISTSAYALLGKECDKIIALNILSHFAAVGQFYLDFHQVEDIEVIMALQEINANMTRKRGLAIS